MNDMKNKKAEIVEIILVTILISFSINLIASSVFSLDDVKNLIIMIVGIIICFSIIIYYLTIKVKSMNINRIINGNIILDVKNKDIYKSLEYHSSWSISDYINAVMLENKEIKKKYFEDFKNVEKYCDDEFKLQDSYISYVLTSAIEYQILDLLTDYIPLNDNDINVIDLDNVPSNIANNMFIKTLSKDYKKREFFKEYENEENENEEIFSLKSDDGYIYNKFKIALPKKSALIKDGNSLIIKSKLYKITIDWGIGNTCFPFPDMDFYNYFSKDYIIDYDDIEIPYYISVDIKYKLFSMFLKKSNKHYL